MTIRVDGVFKFFAKPADGRIRIRCPDQVLAQLGWHVRRVLWHEWILLDGPAEQRAYLEAKLAAANKEHKFWDTQPVPKVDEDTSTEEVGRPIHELKTPDDVSPDPLKLPGGFEWVSMDVTKDEEIDEIYDLLFRNYVEDDDNMFRFDYSPAFLRWALSPPGFKPEWHVGVRVTQVLPAPC